MDEAALAFYREPAAMTELPDHPALASIPTDLDGLRRVVQGLLLHRDWATGYGLAGNVIIDFACLNKVEMLPWDGWGMMTGPHTPVTDEAATVLDEVAALATGDDTDAVRDRYLADDRLRVPAEITSVVDGELVDVNLQL